MNRKSTAPKETQRHEFARMAAELAEPLAAFLDHPLMAENISSRITDALLELADIRRPATSNGELTKDSLNNIATHLSK